MKQTTRREKILIYGGFKLGKSTCWIDVADALYQANVRDVMFYVVDTDFGVEKMLEEYDHLEDMLKIYTPLDFDEMMVASKEIKAEANKGDWVVLDMIEQPWTAAQEHYIQGVYGDEPENYFIEMRRDLHNKGGKGDGRAYGGHEGTDWNWITKTYRRFEQPLTMQGNWNVFGITGERKLDANRGASNDQIKQYKNVGKMAPSGQKGVGHRFDTVLRMTMRASGQRELTLVGDRGREKNIWRERESRVIQIDEPPEAFAQRYLVEVAGWEPTKPKKKSKKDKGKAKAKASAAPTRRRRK